MPPKRRNVSTKPHGIASQYTVSKLTGGTNTGRANIGKFTQRESVWQALPRIMARAQFVPHRGSTVSNRRLS